MQFNDNQPIWLQIYDHVCRAIVSGKWPEAERVPSVRELAAALQVNPNTVMRAYEKLEGDALVVNRRGIGFFVAEGARHKTHGVQRREFLSEQLPALFRRMKELGVEMDTIQECYRTYLKEQNDENKQ